MTPALRRPRRRGPAELNLARRPFVNQRPVRRIGLLMAAAAAVLLVVNLFLYIGYTTDRRHNARELRQIEAAIDAEQQGARRAAQRLEQADLSRQNDLVAFLNQRIAARAFGWSVLFDRLSDLLPADVRLVSLSPSFTAAKEAQGARAPVERRVNLGLQGTSRKPEAVLALVDALFADPAFRDPDLHQEATQGGEVHFTLDVAYLPEVAESAVRATASGEGTR